MKTTTKVKAFAYPVKIKDNRSGKFSEDMIIIPKEWLQLCGSEGLNIADDKCMIYRAYNIRGFEVLEIGKRISLCMDVDLERLYIEHLSKESPAAATEGSAADKTVDAE